jgi:hypothetical protein
MFNKILYLFGYTAIPSKTVYTIAKMLDYSFNPIHYNYSHLTPAEKVIMSEKEFDTIAKIVENKLK